MSAQPIALPRPTACTCCHRRGARILVRTDDHGREQTAVCPTCDTRATDRPGWTDIPSTDPRRVQ